MSEPNIIISTINSLLIKHTPIVAALMAEFSEPDGVRFFLGRNRHQHHALPTAFVSEDQIQQGYGDDEFEARAAELLLSTSNEINALEAQYVEAVGGPETSLFVYGRRELKEGINYNTVVAGISEGAGNICIAREVYGSEDLLFSMGPTIMDVTAIVKDEVNVKQLEETRSRGFRASVEFIVDNNLQLNKFSDKRLFSRYLDAFPNDDRVKLESNGEVYEIRARSGCRTLMITPPNPNFDFKDKFSDRMDVAYIDSFLPSPFEAPKL